MNSLAEALTRDRHSTLPVIQAQLQRCGDILENSARCQTNDATHKPQHRTHLPVSTFVGTSPPAHTSLDPPFMLSTYPWPAANPETATFWLSSTAK